jgi:hypothetical protein
MPKKIELAVREQVMRMIASIARSTDQSGWSHPWNTSKPTTLPPQARDAARMKAAQNLRRFTSEVPERELRGRPVPPCPSASPITPSGSGHCWYASPKNGHVKVRSSAQAIIDAHCGRLSPAEVEILSVIEMHMPDGVRLIGAEWTGSSHQRKFAAIGARRVPARGP